MIVVAVTLVSRGIYVGMFYSFNKSSNGWE